MKKRNYIVAAITIVIIIGLLIYNSSTKNTTFREDVLDQIDTSNVGSIEIIKHNSQGENKVTVTDPSQIKKIIYAFSKMELRKSNNSEIDFTESYWMLFRDNNGKRKLGITLYDNHHLNTFVYDEVVPKKASKSYKIFSGFDLAVIKDLFK